MTLTKEVLKHNCVAGFVKGGTSNKDKSVSFWVAKQRFIVAEKSHEAKVLHAAKRALVQYMMSENKNPKITLILAEPSTRLIRQYMES